MATRKSPATKPTGTPAAGKLDRRLLAETGRLVLSGTSIETLCDIERLRRLRKGFDEERALLDDATGPPTEANLTPAAGYYIGYPLLFEFLTARREAPEETEAQYRTLNTLRAVHAAAARYLVSVAEFYKLDGAPIEVSADLCRELFAQHGLKCRRSVDDWYWPGCLGSFALTLPPDLRERIRRGSEAFSRLQAKLRLSPPADNRPTKKTASDARKEVAAAVKAAGKTASPKRVERFLSSGMNRQKLFSILRELEKEGKYAGFLRKPRARP